MGVDISSHICEVCRSYGFVVEVKFIHM